MKKTVIDRAFGREAFGGDPGAYHTARPDYPAWVFETLREKCGLTKGTALFEIGAGTGKATRQLLNLGASPLVAIEPDLRLAEFLRRSVPDEALRVVTATFEDVKLSEGGFDLGVSATAFHWLNEEVALAKVATLLRPGGWWAMMWNVFGNHDLPDPFHEATKELLNGPASPSWGPRDIPFALDTEARVAALERTQAFELIEHRMTTWSLILDPGEVAALYATYSNVVIRDDREQVLAELKRVAGEEFQGQVTRNMVTSLYFARRRCSPG